MYGLFVAAVFAGALALSAGLIIAAVAPQWRRIARLASGQVEQRVEPLAEAERWRELHLAADRRLPFASVQLKGGAL